MVSRPPETDIACAVVPCCPDDELGRYDDVVVGLLAAQEVDEHASGQFARFADGLADSGLSRP